jgi:hypothetical protein
MRKNPPARRLPGGQAAGIYAPREKTKKKSKKPKKTPLFFYIFVDLLEQ